MIYKRNNKIFDLHSKGLSFADISKQVKLSPERVRQIITSEPNFCIRHTKTFLNSCPYCFLENEYREQISKLDIQELIKEGKTLSKLGRTNLEILKKRMWARIIREKYDLSYGSIGRILKKDHTTVMNLILNK